MINREWNGKQVEICTSSYSIISRWKELVASLGYGKAKIVRITKISLTETEQASRIEGTSL